MDLWMQLLLAPQLITNFTTVIMKDLDDPLLSGELVFYLRFAAQTNNSKFLVLIHPKMHVTFNIRHHSFLLWHHGGTPHIRAHEH